MLADGTMDAVITQDPDTLFESAVRAATDTGVATVAMELYLSENMPPAQLK